MELEHAIEDDVDDFDPNGENEDQEEDPNIDPNTMGNDSIFDIREQDVMTMN